MAIFKRARISGPWWLKLIFFGVMLAAKVSRRFPPHSAELSRHLEYSTRPAQSADVPRAEATLAGTMIPSRGSAQIAQLLANIDRQNLDGECDAVLGSWREYGSLSHSFAYDAAVREAYRRERERVITVCPDLASELPEQP